MRGKKIVLDLEFIPYRRKQEPYCVHEIIEIGAVALDADNEIYDEFQMYVKPQYGTVPPFVTAITGITNEMLVGQVSFSEAMQAFEAWLPQEDSYRFYTWSGSDQHVFQAEAEWKERPLLGNFYGWWVDLQRLHQRIYGFSKPMKLVTAWVRCRFILKEQNMVRWQMLGTPQRFCRNFPMFAVSKIISQLLMLPIILLVTIQAAVLRLDDCPFGKRHIVGKNKKIPLDKKRLSNGIFLSV